MKRAPTEVLLVDDNPADLELTSEFLSRSLCPSRIHTARDGDEALNFLHRRGSFVRAERPDLIVLDLNLPRKPGHAVLSAIKGDAELQRVPVIVFSTSQAPLDIQHSYQLGANSYVCKAGNLNDFAMVATSIANFWFCCACTWKTSKAGPAAQSINNQPIDKENA